MLKKQRFCSKRCRAQLQTYFHITFYFKHFILSYSSHNKLQDYYAWPYYGIIWTNIFDPRQNASELSIHAIRSPSDLSSSTIVFIIDTEIFRLCGDFYHLSPSKATMPRGRIDLQGVTGNVKILVSIIEEKNCRLERCVLSPNLP